jgi:toxin-antitoxin system PIN domain toxin
MAHLCDGNIWLALALSGHQHHPAARRWLETIEAAESLVFCRATQRSFLRLLTNVSVLALYGEPPLTNERVWAVYDALLADYMISLLGEEPPGLGAR